MTLQHLKDTGRRFTYDKYGWDVGKDNNFMIMKMNKGFRDCKRIEHMWPSNQTRKEMVT